MKIKLDQFDTSLIMSIKNHKIKIKLKYDEEDKFPNEILNLDAYKNIGITYANSRYIPIESVRLEYVNKALLDIFELVCPHKFKELINEIVYKNSLYKNRSNKEVLFFELVSYLEALTMLDENGDEIYDLDYSLVETKDI